MNIFKVDGKQNILALIVSILIAEGTGMLSGFLSNSNKGFYVGLKRPTFSPPGWIFPIVWILLYFLMAVAIYRIWLKGKEGEKIKKAFIYYIVQLILNFFWSILFFGFGRFGAAFFELMLLLIFILMTTFEFYKIDKKAAYLMIPYILWVSFAGVLNYTIWMLNK